MLSITVAQVTPERLYNGIDRPLEVRVSIPEGGTDAEILLLRPLTAEVVTTAKVQAGSTDLAKLFPNLWSREEPGLLYAQLSVDGKKVGPAIVLQPMLSPKLPRNAEGGAVEFTREGVVYSGIRAYVDRHLVFETSMGAMEFRLRPDMAPNTAWTMTQLVEGGYYSDVIFHRIVARRADGSPFVIQGGDPSGSGSGGPGFNYALEDSKLLHDFGVLSIARTNDPFTNGSQFFVCLSREGTRHLDGRYASFGEAVSGADTILKLAEVAVGAGDRPVDPPRILRAFSRPAPPYGEGPAPVKRPS
jgi:peptidyl-prolyl cis-trans isomerase B (cyclophilin B)